MATGRIELDVEDRKLLEDWSRAQRVEHRLKIRSQIILKATEGCSGREIGKSLSITEVTVSSGASGFCVTESLDWRTRRAVESRPNMMKSQSNGCWSSLIETRRRAMGAGMGG